MFFPSGEQLGTYTSAVYEGGNDLTDLGNYGGNERKAKKFAQTTAFRCYKCIFCFTKLIFTVFSTLLIFLQSIYALPNYFCVISYFCWLFVAALCWKSKVGSPLGGATLVSCQLPSQGGSSKKPGFFSGNLAKSANSGYKRMSIT